MKNEIKECEDPEECKKSGFHYVYYYFSKHFLLFIISILIHS